MKYKNLFVVALLVALMAACSSKKTVPTAILHPAIQPALADTADINPRVIIVFYDSAKGPQPLRKAIEAHKCSIIYEYQILKGMAIRIPEGADPQKELEYFRKVDGVLSAEPDRRMQLNGLN